MYFISKDQIYQINMIDLGSKKGQVEVNGHSRRNGHIEDEQGAVGSLLAEALGGNRTRKRRAELLST